MLEAAFLWLIGTGLLALVLIRRKRRRSRSKGRKRFTKTNPAQWSAVYVMRLDRSRHYKIGLTGNLSAKRKYGIRSAIKRITGHAPQLTQVMAVDINYAIRVEKLAQAKLDRYRAPIGTMREFFHFPNLEDDEAHYLIGRALVEAAAEVRQDAMARGRWYDHMERSARLVRGAGRNRVEQPLFTSNP